MSALRERLLIYAENHLTTADELRAEPGCEMLVCLPNRAACMDAVVITSGGYMTLQWRTCSGVGRSYWEG